jgi:hypothetical protein
MAAVAAIVAVLLAGAVELLRLRGGIPLGAGASQTRPVGFHGVQVLVPSSWPLNATKCGTPIRDTVIVGQGVIALCLLAPRPTVSVVELAPLAQAQAGGQTAAAGRAIRLDGHPARRGADRLPDGRSRVVLVIPDLDVAVTATSRDAALVRRIIASATIRPVDAAGCHDRVARLRPAGPPARQGAAARLVPASPTAGSICRYSDLRLERSTTLTAGQLRHLLGVLNGLPAGTSRPGGGYAISADSCQQEERRGFVLRFDHASGPAVEVFVHIGGCGQLSAANGARTTKLSPELVTTLTGLVGYDAGYPNPADLH